MSPCAGVRGWAITLLLSCSGLARVLAVVDGMWAEVPSDTWEHIQDGVCSSVWILEREELQSRTIAADM